MKRVTLLLGLVLALTCVLTGPASATAASAGSVRPQTLDQGILARLNAVRSSHGLRPLTVSGELRKAAVFHSHSMLERGFFAHESADGSPFDKRVKRYYRTAGYSAWSVGENLLYSTSAVNPESTIKAWLGSPPHRKNMLNPAWREVGIASLHAAAAGGLFGGRPTWVVTMDFGVRSGDRAAAKPVEVLRVVKVERRIERVLPRPAGSA